MFKNVNVLFSQQRCTWKQEKNIYHFKTQLCACAGLAKVAATIYTNGDVVQVSEYFIEDNNIYFRFVFHVDIRQRAAITDAEIE